jgi:hypothetical protein
MAGAVLVAASAFVPDRGIPRDDRIVVTAGQVEHLAARFARTWRRPPSATELVNLVDEYVREETAYREGLALGLDGDDVIIRRRIRQKLEFIALEIAGLAEPSDEELAAYLAANRDDFTEKVRFTFVHIFLDPSLRGDDLDSDAAGILALLAHNPDRDIRDLGDRILIPPLQENLATGKVAEVFGPEFARALTNEEAQFDKSWFGPVESRFGLHLVRIMARTEARLPALDEIRDEVIREWEHARGVEAKEKFYSELLDRYEVTVEWPVAADRDSTP